MRKDFTAKQNKRVVRRYPLGASKDFRATGFGQAEFPIGCWINVKNLHLVD